MVKVKGKRELDKLGKEGIASLYPKNIKITVGVASCGLASGAAAVFDAFNEKISKKDGVILSHAGCVGMCHNEPVVEVQMPGIGRMTYGKVTPADVDKIVESVKSGKVPPKFLSSVNVDLFPLTGEKKQISGKKSQAVKAKPLRFYNKQKRVAMRNCGVINPESLEEYIARGGYYALLNALSNKSPEAVIDEIDKSGLRGRGGAGFPTGRKWNVARAAAGKTKYIVCNADEGDPGAYMDRAILEGDPHSVIEGMIIAAYAIGSSKGYIYVRSEYPLAVLRLEKALMLARKAGILGKSVMGKKFSFDIEIYQGAGAFVCGEETALIKSIEGTWGEPQGRPPYPAVSGLFGCPTVINNVETLANVSAVMFKGAKWYSSIGCKESKGTKVFSLVGKVKNVGLVEVPMGTTLKEIIYDIGGGVSGKGKAKAVQTGGPSGGCIPASLFKLPVDYVELYRAGSIMGSGGMVVMDDATCMVDVAKYFLTFLEDESCGKCVPCRVGVRKMREIVEDISKGKGREGDIALLEEMAGAIKDGSFCNFGATSPNPVLSTIRYFRDEYEAHINNKKCPAGVCSELIEFTVIKEKCISCSKCKKACPADAVWGAVGSKYKIVKDKCIKCRACIEVCPVEAIEVK
ncbi:MAG: NADH-quinone oxidoreductase subunit NuoF [Candidatus Schekmanbacteria bacterium]|nr:NADH-quinone oxidoreductase subunit NuoF [Candidatus Schekmanbacteria bacterium]